MSSLLKQSNFKPLIQVSEIMKVNIRMLLYHSSICEFFPGFHLSSILIIIIRFSIWKECVVHVWMLWFFQISGMRKSKEGKRKKKSMLYLPLTVNSAVSYVQFVLVNRQCEVKKEGANSSPNLCRSLSCSITDQRYLYRTETHRRYLCNKSNTIATWLSQVSCSISSYCYHLILNMKHEYQ